jgi:Kef-type K+ transport system membrane component KefB
MLTLLATSIEPGRYEEVVREETRRLASIDAESLLLPVLVQLIVIIAAARLFGALARRVGQPSVIGEIVAGLLLGPSLLGWLAPDLFHALFRPDLESIDRPLADALMSKIFTVIAQIGLIFLLFLVGLEFEGKHVRANGRAAVLISIAGIAVPFGLGAALAPAIHPHLEAHPVAGAVSLPGLTLFLGVALSITAIPVLGRIMMELQITRTRLLLASVAAVVRSNFDPLETGRMVLLTIGFALALFLVVRPLLVHYFQGALRANHGGMSATAFAVLLVALLVSALATNLIGIFAVFGAFALGAALSDQEDLRGAVSKRLHDIVTGFFVPVFFTYTGLRTDITGIHGAAMWLILGAVIAAAVTGKLAGCGAAARLSGFTWKESGIIGAMMNSRGLMALIAINVGYELGVVPRSLFSILVLMALVTTALTTPLLLLLRRGTEIEEPIARSGFLRRKAIAGEAATHENAKVP